LGGLRSLPVGRIRIFDSRSAGWKGVIVGAIVCVCGEF
jgi:hypothetical protein